MRKMFSEQQIAKIAEQYASGLPEIKSGDAGKALLVNESETKAEWANIPDELPTIQSGDAGKLLAVNSTETGVEWKADNSLQLPESAPAAQQLVGINTSGEQNALGIGNGLAVSNNAINLSTTPSPISISYASSDYAKTYTAGSVTFVEYSQAPSSKKPRVALGVCYATAQRNQAWYKLFLEAGLTIAYEVAYASADDNKVHYAIGLYNGTNADITIPSGPNYSQIYYYI